MVVNQAYLWPLAAVACGTAAVAVLRCLTLFIGLRLALRGAPKKDRQAIYREFARALGFKSGFKETAMEIPLTRPYDDGLGGSREPIRGRSGR